MSAGRPGSPTRTVSDERNQPAGGPSSAAEREWTELLADHLPGGQQDEYWRSAGRGLPPTAEQGWKLHLSATVLTAPKLIRRAALVLNARPVHWKVAASLAQVHQLNCGLYFGYSQIGKIITVYAGDPETARDLASALDTAVGALDGPRIPFDVPLRTGSRVHYRYGVINPSHFIDVEGVRVPALVDPEGHLVADQRRAGFAVPDWVPPLMENDPPPRYEGALATKYLVYEVITQRGKGGTYRALNLETRPVSHCIVREGRRHGETDWDGVDGRDRVAHEMVVLQDLSRSAARVPLVLDTFVADDHLYLVLESVAGQDLQRLLASPAATSGVDELLTMARQAAQLVAHVHAAGWAWRDCKAANIVCAPTGLYAVDFEGACRLGARNLSPWGSPGHVPPEWPSLTSPAAQDLYALGAVLSQIFDAVAAIDPAAAGHGKRIAAELRHPDPHKRPPASRVLARLG